MIEDIPRYEYATYWFTQTVYLRVRAEKEKGMITGVNLRPTGIMYWVQWGSGHETAHFDFELSTEYVPDFDTYHGDTGDDEASKPK